MKMFGKQPSLTFYMIILLNDSMLLCLQMKIASNGDFGL